ncbi:MarR family winged helix-turn-helix transcriptional regulator [Notoacmeibacter ruber]|uniref:MarR family transcriptional regulator n=1 Tax=Notoacmeibacter ruber TaxID=2670375 RepID=A0A3L7JDH3_9HYPH|nr:MarR family winged helix-turn-helix transcriptional regulator [Notoacmeibacter ruber]RLQ88520.1 MarR family transcriptional regulator [Notoacmeibacter ruber]
MTESGAFDLKGFLPYLLNQAAEETSLHFSNTYRERYGLLRTEWRVLFHLGRYGDLTASQISTMAKMHKTKISRAVSALEDKHFLKRDESREDRRREILSLLPQGKAAYDDLTAAAEIYNRELACQFSPEEWAILKDSLTRLAQLPQTGE